LSPKFPTIIFIACIAAVLTACGSHADATKVAAVAPLSAPAKPTPPPFHPAVVKIRAVRRFVADPASCAALGARVHVATVYEVQPGFFGTQAVCWREVRTGDSAFGSAVHIAVYVPRVRSHEGWTFASPSTSGTGTIATCIAHGQRTRVPVVALTTSDRAAGRCLVPLDTSSTDSSEDSSVANLQFAVVLPAEDVR